MKNIDFYLGTEAIKVSYQKIFKQGNSRNVPLYHYTDTEVLDSLLSGATFWATNIFYQNDSEEYKNGVKLLETKLADIVSTSKDQRKNACIEGALKAMKKEDAQNNIGLFTISFSKEEDSLHQWITYAKESGVAIELDNSKINELTLMYQKNDQEFGEFAKVPLVPLDYTPNSLQEKLSMISAIEGDMELPINISLRLMASYLKNPSFKSEKEVRLTFVPVAQGNDSDTTQIFYKRSQLGILKPYIKVKFCNKIDNDKPCLPLKSITVGPSGKQQVIFNSVVHRLNYGRCNIYNYSSEGKQLINNFCLYLTEVNNLIDTSRAESHDENIVTQKPDALAQKILISFIKLCKKRNREIKDLPVIKYIINEWLECNKTFLRSLGFTSKVLNPFSGDETKVSDKQLKLLETIKENLYFSKEGVIVRKSKIPYIF